MYGHVNMYFGLSLAVLSVATILSYFFIFRNNNLSVTSMANYGLLLVPNVTKIYNGFLKASKQIQKVLYININTSLEGLLPVINKQIVNVYSEATYHCPNLDVRLMLKPYEAAKNIKTTYPIDLILYDKNSLQDIERIKLSLHNLTPDCAFQHIDVQDEAKDITNVELVKRYEYVALGGTFDRLHNGHKILLSQAVLRSTKHVTVGVTDVNMIQSKKLWELIEPVELRIKSVLDFLIDINPDLEYNVVPIQDLYGPTKYDPKYQMLLVSEETKRGAVKINEARAENGLPLLETYTIDLVQDSSHARSHEEEEKVSSSNHRMRMLGTLLKPPKPNPNIPDWPYVIGLAGGIASGKSSIAERLKSKGAAVVNCDTIAHDLYRPGLPMNRTLAEEFGEDIITDSGEVDRKKLGQIVFSDKEQLEKLNGIIWPAVIEEAQRRVKELGEQGHRVVVMEAAVMIRARWYTFCHQLWTVIIPPEEAIKRLQSRNGLTEEQAKQRVDAQPSNLDQVTLANIVFSPYWSYEYTQAQVDRAWEHLQEYLDTRR